MADQIKNNVLIGKDNWLFLFGGDQEQFKYLLGVEGPVANSRRNFIENYQNRQSWLTTQGILFKHLVFPSKPVVMHRFLPEEYQSVSSFFLKEYHNHLPSTLDEILYPRSILCELPTPGFRKLDTHNSDEGCLAITKYIVSALGINTVADTLVRGRRTLGGDLASMVGENMTHEEQIIFAPKDNIFTFDNRTFLPGNTNEVTILVNNNSVTNQRLLIFGDSFFKSILRFLTIYFSDVMYVRSTFMHKDIVHLFQPDIVLTGNAERYLRLVRSDTQMDNFLFSLYGDSNYCPGEEYTAAFKAQLSYRYNRSIYLSWRNQLASNANR